MRLFRVAVLAAFALSVPAALTPGADGRHPAIADLAVELVGEPASVQTGDTVTYRITLSNRGPDDAEAAQLLVRLSDGVALEDAATSAGYCPRTPTVTCYVGSMPRDDAVTSILVVRPSRAGAMTLAVRAWSDEYDPAPDNNEATVTTTVVERPPGAPPPPPAPPPSPSPPTAPVRDGVAPRIRALPSFGRRGGEARIRYRVADASGRTSERIRVYRRGRTLATVVTRLTPKAAGALYHYVPWRVPRRLVAGRLRFCVWATDPAGNRSPASCAALRVR